MGGKHLLCAYLIHGTPNPNKTGKPEVPKTNQPNVGIWRFRHGFGIGDYLYLGKAKGISSSHTKSTKVIPVIRMSASHCGGWLSAGHCRWRMLRC